MNQAVTNRNADSGSPSGADTLTKDELIERAKTDKRLARELRSYGSTTYGAEMLASWAPFWNRADLRRPSSSDTGASR